MLNIFSDCSGLKKVIVPDIAAWCKISFGDHYANPLYYAHHLYSDENTEITELVIPNSVTSIGNYAFYGCSGLTSITIPNSVTSIRNYAFHGCSGLTSITIPNSVTSIGDDAFLDCSGLTSITIPNSVTSIGGYAFEGTKWYNDQPDGVVYAGKVAYKYKGTMPNGTSIVLKDGIVSISPVAFEGCSGLTSITIPNSVTSIGEFAFYECSGLTSITIPNSVTSIGDYAFRGCSGLTSIIIPNSVTTIGDDAFVGLYYLYVDKSHISLLTLLRKGYWGRIYDKNTKESLPVSISPTRISIAEMGDSVDIVSSELSLDGIEGITELSGLDPRKQVRFKWSLSYQDEQGEKYSLNIDESLSTPSLTLTTLQPKVATPGNVIVAAESNIDNDEESVGFEWRRTDWTDDFKSNEGAAFLYEGTMEGSIRNLNTEKLWKFRPYYESKSGNRYYGKWMGLDPTNTSYFEPTVHTYATVGVTGNEAEVRGYAMRGSDNTAQQGFRYWPQASEARAVKAGGAVSVPGDALTVTATGTVMTAMLKGLRYSTDYCVVAFVTTSEGETFYGERQTFRTGIDTSGIEAPGATTTATATARYDLQGHRLASPRRGLNIIRMSDGTVRKVVVK